MYFVKFSRSLGTVLKKIYIDATVAPEAKVVIVKYLKKGNYAKSMFSFII